LQLDRFDYQARGADAVHYLLMIYDDEKTFAGMPEAKKTALMQEYRAFTRDIVKSGHFRAGAQL